jgi:hypothetical protein
MRERERDLDTDTQRGRPHEDRNRVGGMLPQAKYFLKLQVA